VRAYGVVHGQHPDLNVLELQQTRRKVGHVQDLERIGDEVPMCDLDAFRNTGRPAHHIVSQPPLPKETEPHTLKNS
jgi:hypothetical protein